MAIWGLSTIHESEVLGAQLADQMDAQPLADYAETQQHDSILAQASLAQEPQDLEPQEQEPSLACETPCPCCYYRISSLDENGEYTPGWRKFGGRYMWFHKSAPHARPWDGPGLLADSGENDASVPRCACCYYNYSFGLPPGPGWLLCEAQLLNGVRVERQILDMLCSTFGQVFQGRLARDMRMVVDPMVQPQRSAQHLRAHSPLRSALMVGKEIDCLLCPGAQLPVVDIDRSSQRQHMLFALQEAKELEVALWPAFDNTGRLFAKYLQALPGPLSEQA